MSPKNDLFAQLNDIKVNYLKSVASYSGLCTHGLPISNNGCEPCGLAVLTRQLQCIRTHYETILLPVEEKLREFNQLIASSADRERHEMRSLARKNVADLRVQWLDLLADQKRKWIQTWGVGPDAKRVMEEMFYRASQVASRFDV